VRSSQHTVFRGEQVGSQTGDVLRAEEGQVCLTPEIPTTQEAEIRRTMVQGQSGQIVRPYLNKQLGIVVQICNPRHVRGHR
jgi:hypothetical protein